ncbi:MAG: rod-binding protein [Methylococcaceae bacterium]|nr:rod-binding protein [Methylococcaceae bacterium]
MAELLSNPSLYTDFNGLAELRNRAKADKNQAVGEVAQQFEALMIQMMLKEMRNASPKSEFFDTEGMRVYQDLQDKQVALEMAKRNTLGVAQFIEQQMVRQGFIDDESTDVKLKNRVGSPKPEKTAGFALMQLKKQLTLPSTEPVSFPLKLNREAGLVP